MNRPKENSRLSIIVATTFQIAALAFIFFYEDPIQSALPTPALLVFVAIYFSGVRAISKWLQATIRGSAA